MASNLAEWDAKHLAAAESPAAEPASIFRELFPLLPHGPALDLASGTGRHALLLAARHQSVTAADGSEIALKTLEGRATAVHIKVHKAASLNDIAPLRASGIHLVHANLEEIILPANSFDLILCFRYLQRSLFRQIEQALTPGGVLLFETFTKAQLEFVGGPRNPEFLLEPGELRMAFPSLHVLFFRELRAGQGIASLLAQKP
jgi:SAM-dependent methyltransferase